MALEDKWYSSVQELQPPYLPIPGARARGFYRLCTRLGRYQTPYDQHSTQQGVALFHGITQHRRVKPSSIRWVKHC